MKEKTKNKNGAAEQSGGETANEGGEIERAHDTNWRKNKTDAPT